MEQLLAEHRIEARPVQDRDRSFERFLQSRTATLANEEARVRLARTITLTDMPDIWEDKRATEAFETSFFEDLAYRLDSQGDAGGRVVRSFAIALELEGGETAADIRKLLKTRLPGSPWREDEWQG